MEKEISEKNIVNNEENKQTEKCLSIVKSTGKGDIFVVADKAGYVICIFCQKSIQCKNKTHVLQHIASKGHQKNFLSYANDQLKIHYLYQLFKPGDRIKAELCLLSIMSNIPFHALPRSKNILKRLIPLGGHISEHDDLAFYTVPLYNYNVQQVKDFLKGKDITKSLDGSTDDQDNYVTKVMAIVGRTSLVLDTVFMEKESATALYHVKVIKKVVEDLGLEKEQVYAFITDSGANVKAGVSQYITTSKSEASQIVCSSHLADNVLKKLLKFPDTKLLVETLRPLFSKKCTQLRWKFLDFYENEAGLVVTLPLLRKSARSWGSWWRAYNDLLTDYKDADKAKLFILFSVRDEKELTKKLAPLGHVTKLHLLQLWLNSLEDVGKKTGHLVKKAKQLFEGKYVEIYTMELKMPTIIGQPIFDGCKWMQGLHYSTLHKVHDFWVDLKARFYKIDLECELPKEVHGLLQRGQ